MCGIKNSSIYRCTYAVQTLFVLLALTDFWYILFDLLFLCPPCKRQYLIGGEGGGTYRLVGHVFKRQIFSVCSPLSLSCFGKCSVWIKMVDWNHLSDVDTVRRHSCLLFFFSLLCSFPALYELALFFFGVSSGCVFVSPVCSGGFALPCSYEHRGLALCFLIWNWGLYLFCFFVRFNACMRKGGGWHPSGNSGKVRSPGMGKGALESHSKRGDRGKQL